MNKLEPELLEKIDIAFPLRRELDEISRKDDIATCYRASRINALKMAYDFAIPQVTGRIWHTLSIEQQMETIQNVLELADINFKYINDGSTKLH